jgi:hypothetical protein
VLGCKGGLPTTGPENASIPSCHACAQGKTDFALTVATLWQFAERHSPTLLIDPAAKRPQSVRAIGKAKS